MIQQKVEIVETELTIIHYMLAIKQIFVYSFQTQFFTNQYLKNYQQKFYKME